MDTPILLDWDFLMQSKSKNEHLDNLEMYTDVYKTFLRVASPTFSDYFVFCGFNPNISGDQRMGFQVEEGNFTLKIQQITRDRKRKMSSSFNPKAEPKRHNLLKDAGGGILDPEKPFIVLNEQTLNERQCAKMAYTGAGFPAETFDNDYERLSMETMRRLAVDAAKLADDEYE